VHSSAAPASSARGGELGLVLRWCAGRTRQAEEDLLQSLLAELDVAQDLVPFGEPGGELGHRRGVDGSPFGQRAQHVVARSLLGDRMAEVLGEADDVQPRGRAEAQRPSGSERAEVARASRCHDPTVVDDHDPVGELLGLFQVVRGEHHGDPPLGEICDDLADHGPPDRVHTRRRLVQEGDLRSADQRQRELEALLLAAREAAEGRTSDAPEVETVQELVAVERIGEKAAPEPDRVQWPHGRVDPAGLEHHADPRGERSPLGDGVEPEHFHRTRRRTAVALARFDDARLAGAVRPEKREHRSGVGVEVHSCHRFDRSVAHDEAAHPDQGRTRASDVEFALGGHASETNVAEVMIDIRLVRADPGAIRASLQRRGVDPSAVDRLVDLDRRVRELQVARDEARAEVKRCSAAFAEARRQGDEHRAEALAEESRSLAKRAEELESLVDEVGGELRDRLLELPNVPSPDCPDGEGAEDNVVLRYFVPGEGDADHFDASSRFGPEQRVPHWEVGAELGILDLAAGAKLAGAMFPLFRGQGSALIRALSAFALDRHSDAFEEIRPPTFVRTETMVSTGHLPKFADDAYHIERDDLWAIPTAEVPLTSIAREEILREDALPVRMCASTPCFRREAGSAGRDTRGLLRVHEFDKVEILAYTTPEQAADVHAELLSRAEGLLRELGLVYRVVDLCAGDLGQSSARTFDLEAYAPGCDRWLEVSSVSWFSDYQARRANVRYRPADGGPPRFVHTLNGSALAWPRIWAALVESGRQADGSVRLPECLGPYLGGRLEIRRSTTEGARR